jgi:hypothetical protein
MCSPFRSSAFERPSGSRRGRPILLATSTIDVGVDALAEAGISELMSRRWSAPSWQRALVRCLRRGF